MYCLMMIEKILVDGESLFLYFVIDGDCDSMMRVIIVFIIHHKVIFKEMASIFIFMDFLPYCLIHVFVEFQECFSLEFGSKFSFFVSLDCDIESFPITHYLIENYQLIFWPLMKRVHQ